jgi:predicted phage terminase large subunit-like protein
VLRPARWRCKDCWRFITVDPAATAPKAGRHGSDPDWTVISTWAVTPNGDLLWLDVDRFRLEIPQIVPRIELAWVRHHPLFVAVEAVASNCAVLQFARQTRMVVRECNPAGQRKLVRATPAMILLEQGKVWLPQEGPGQPHWLDDAESELLRFTGQEGQDGHDDQVDTLSDAAALREEYSSGGGKPLNLGGGSFMGAVPGSYSMGSGPARPLNLGGGGFRR